MRQLTILGPGYGWVAPVKPSENAVPLPTPEETQARLERIAAKQAELREKRRPKNKAIGDRVRAKKLAESKDFGDDRDEWL